ncbi:Protein CBG25581 [Caenorhabditis briggsae]|uniref:Protein CBG25581 n=1 Tax=Caenorhabditis briggsae TaxID=6238 RepID=B6IF68_CAEBR|nr:Protein CBG25581 [Caenorhabditis briggsae]CAR98548.1 Protein CBG25581 [Caenorhabditis briggsae]
MSQLKLQTFVNDIQKIDGNKNLDFSEILEYTKNEYTKETAQNYLDALEKMIATIDESKLSQSDKYSYKYAFTKHLTSECKSECKSIIINCLGISNKKKSLILKETQKEYQKERDEHNELRKKYNEKQKEQIVEVPSIDLSLTLKNKKTLTNRECLDFLNDLDIDDTLLSDKFKRVSVSEDFPNVSRAYVKKGTTKENNIIQRQQASFRSEKSK